MKRLVEEFVKHDAGLAHSQLIARRRLGNVLAYGKRTGPNSSTSQLNCAMFFNIEIQVQFAVGFKIQGKTGHVVVDAEDALIAALKVKMQRPEALIAYVRQQNSADSLTRPS